MLYYIVWYCLILYYMAGLPGGQEEKSGPEEKAGATRLDQARASRRRQTALLLQAAAILSSGPYNIVI